jgi:hypothetical protein
MIKPGDQFASAVSSTRVVVVRAPAAGPEPEIACGGEPMVRGTAARPGTPGATATTLIGKRYTDAAGTVELLCTASGEGELSCDGAPMVLKAAKPLPASD